MIIKTKTIWGDGLERLASGISYQLDLSSLFYLEDVMRKKSYNKGKKNPFYGKKHSEETKKKISLARIGKYAGKNNPMYGKPSPTRGRHLSEEHKRKISLANKGENNGMWKGDKCGDKALHKYIIRQLPKPDLCEACKTKKPYDLANKGVYSRNLKNWEWLCRACHMLKDKRMKNLKQYQS